MVTTASSFLGPPAPKDPYKQLFAVEGLPKPKPTFEQRLEQKRDQLWRQQPERRQRPRHIPKTVCGMTVLETSPSLDPHILVRVPDDGGKHTMRVVPTTVCQPEVRLRPDATNEGVPKARVTASRSAGLSDLPETPHNLYVRLTADTVKERALDLGFDVCGIAPAESFPELAFLESWLARGYAGEMAYMARSAERRADVRASLPSARSVIVTGTVYNTERPYSTEIADPATAKLARYAWGDDYHDVIGARLDALLAWMREVHDEPFEARPYVDTGPVQERAYAQRAGLGWIGKNACLINRERGSWLFLSEILCSLPLAPDAPSFDQCGTCTLCLDACPTGALVAPGTLDSTRCISYLTIELKTDIPAEQRAAIGTHAYGCDICQEVCPWNARPATSADPAWQPRAALDSPRLVDLWRLSDDELRATLKGSAMRRAGVTRLRRNLAIAMDNAGVRH